METRQYKVTLSFSKTRTTITVNAKDEAEAVEVAKKSLKVQYPLTFKFLYPTVKRVELC